MDVNKGKQKYKDRLKSIDVRKYSIFIAFIIIVVMLSIVNDHFLTVSNFINILRQISFSGLMAMGMTFVIITGGIDLSVGSVAALCGIIAAMFSREGNHPWPLLLAVGFSLCAAALCGLISGVMITKGRMPPFIATMVMMTVARGFGLVLCKGRPITGYTKAYATMGAGYIVKEPIPIPIPVIVLVIVLFISYLLLNKMRFGRHILAVGGSEAAAKASGLNIDRIKIQVYIFSAVLAGLAGILLSSRVNAASPTACEGYEMDAIAAAVIGGTSMSGGRGSVLATILGAVIIGTINNGLDLLNVSSYYQDIISGIIIAVAVLLDRKK